VFQESFVFETGRHEIGLVQFYAYVEIPKAAAIVYVGQSVDMIQRHSGHLSGDIEFDRILRSRPKDFKLKWLDKVRDYPGGPTVTEREFDLIDKYGTWIELGVGYNRRVKKSWLQRAREHFDGYGVPVDFLGGDGAYASVREFRRWHKKGDHWNWYRHIVYQLHRTQEHAEQMCALRCWPLSKRETEDAVDCDPSSHSIVHFYWDRKDRQWKHKLIFTEVINEEEQIPF
jgi:hypothetical protein